MSTAHAILAVAAWATALIILFFLGDALLLIFAGLLFAFFLDAAVRGLGHVVGVHRLVRLAIVVVLILTALVAFFMSSGTVIFQQSGEVFTVLIEQLKRLQSLLAEYTGIDLSSGAGDDFSKWLPDASVLLGRATSAVTGVLGFIGNAIIIGMIGAFLALDPWPYHDGLVRLFPLHHHERAKEVLAEIGDKLRWWLAGMAINVTVIAVLYWIGLTLIGMPYALALAAIAGIFAFIPNLGPVIAAIPILLVGLSQSVTTAVLALGLYLAVQMLESYLLTPVVQQKMVRLYPAVTLSVQVIFALMFGILGLALATPIAAVAQIFVQRIYIEDVLGQSASSEHSA